MAFLHPLLEPRGILGRALTQSALSWMFSLPLLGAGLLLRQSEALRGDLAVLGDLLSACPPALLPPGCLATAFSYHYPGRASAWYLEENPVTSLVAEEVPIDSNVMRAISMSAVISSGQSHAPGQITSTQPGAAVEAQGGPS